jgi:hypothetical protein
VGNYIKNWCFYSAVGNPNDLEHAGASDHTNEQFCVKRLVLRLQLNLSSKQAFVSPEKEEEVTLFRTFGRLLESPYVEQTDDKTSVSTNRALK